MKYILRLVVVAVICVGVFFGVRAIVNNKKPYSISEDYLSVQTNFKQLDNSVLKLNGMSAPLIDNLMQYNSIYSFSKNSLNTFIDEIEVLSLSKKNSGELKTFKKNLNNKITELKLSIDKIYDYKTNESDPNAEYLNGLIESSNNKFISFNKTLNETCLFLQNLINDEVYGNKNYNFKDVLNANLLNMIKVYLENDKGYEYVAQAISKLNDYVNSNKPSTTKASSFVQNYYSFTNDSLLRNYKTYFEQNSSFNTNFTLLINFVLTGEYYEKV